MPFLNLLDILTHQWISLTWWRYSFSLSFSHFLLALSRVSSGSWWKTPAERIGNNEGWAEVKDWNSRTSIARKTLKVYDGEQWHAQWLTLGEKVYVIIFNGCFFSFIWVFPENRGIPKWMVKVIGKPLLKWMIWGHPYFWKHPFRWLRIWKTMDIFFWPRPRSLGFLRPVRCRTTNSSKWSKVRIWVHIHQWSIIHLGFLFLTCKTCLSFISFVFFWGGIWYGMTFPGYVYINATSCDIIFDFGWQMLHGFNNNTHKPRPPSQGISSLRSWVGRWVLHCFPKGRSIPRRNSCILEAMRCKNCLRLTTTATLSIGQVEIYHGKLTVIVFLFSRSL